MILPRSASWCALVFAASFLMAACSSVPGKRAASSQPLEHFALEGRFGLRDRGQAYSGRVHWRHSRDGEQVLVQDPFGGGVAELTDTAAGARMVLASGERSEAADSAQLMQALTGIALPVRSVARWLTGRSLNALEPARDALGRPTEFAAEGWTIRYEYEGSAPEDADLLPSRVFANNARGVDLRLAIDNWTLEPPP